MHLKKRVIAIGALLLMVAGVVYGSTREMSQAGENSIRESLTGSFGSKETIYFWYTDEDMTSFFNSAAVEFGEREGVRVIPVLASDSEYLEAINQASLHTAQIPDVYLISHDSLEKAYLSGLACEVEDKSKVCSEANFPAAALDAVSYHDRTVAYPLCFETSALVYNETYLETWARQQAERELAAAESGETEDLSVDPETADLDEAQVEALAQEYFAQAIPSTVDDILNIADTFDAPEGVDVMKWDVSAISYNYWIVGNYMVVGGDTGDDKSAVNINNAETVKCLEVYKALNQFFSMESDTVTYESVIQDFIEGRTIFTVATTDVVRRLEEAKADGSFAYEYGIAVMPEVSGELKSRSLSVTEAVAVNGYSEHRELANAFASYLVTEGAEELYGKTGKAAANIHADAENAPLQIFKLEYADSISMPKMMETGNFWLYLEVLFSKVWNGGDVPVLLQELADRISAQTAAL